MIEALLQHLAPHYCYGCGEIGAVICHNCKYDITEESFLVCLVCVRPTKAGICSACRTSYERAWCVGDRSGVLAQVVDAYKFKRVRAAHQPLAELFDATVDSLPGDTVVVSVPTVRSHVRQRGYDHAGLIARRFAGMRGLRFASPLSRKSTTVQRGVSKRQRMEQAKDAFRCTGLLNPDIPYLLIDDIVTTNATLRYAAQALKDAGAQQVWVAVVARQPLDKPA